MAAVWNTKADSTEFCLDHAPLLDLEPFLEQHEIEHYHLEPSSIFQLGSGRAA